MRPSPVATEFARVAAEFTRVATEGADGRVEFRRAAGKSWLRDPRLAAPERFAVPVQVKVSGLRVGRNAKALCIWLAVGLVNEALDSAYTTALE